MKIVKPSVEILTELNGEEILKFIERIGRVCYKSEDKITEESAEKFIEMLIKNGHESVLEHFNITVKFITDRGISHEIVRHRIASYSQESSRYCNYGNDKFGGDITVIEPIQLECLNEEDSHLTEEYMAWFNNCNIAEESYFKMLNAGVKPQTARSVLPTCTKTEIIMTTNLRSWRNFLKLRTSKGAHPDIRLIAFDLLEQFRRAIPVIVKDIESEVK